MDSDSSNAAEFLVDKAATLLDRCRKAGFIPGNMQSILGLRFSSVPPGDLKALADDLREFANIIRSNIEGASPLVPTNRLMAGSGLTSAESDPHDPLEHEISSLQQKIETSILFQGRFLPDMTLGELITLSQDDKVNSIRVVDVAGNNILKWPSIRPPQYFSVEGVVPCLSWEDELLGSGSDLLFAVVRLFTKLISQPAHCMFNAALWNKARPFNRDKFLALRFSGFVVSPGAGDYQCAIQCSNLSEILGIKDPPRPRKRLVWPCHPTFPIPWRSITKLENGELHEDSLGATKDEALQNCASVRVIRWQEESRQKYPPQDVFELEQAEELSVDQQIAEALTEAQKVLLFCEDSPDLPVLGIYQLASAPSKVGLKAREIWFQRYREVLAPALPDARTATVFLLNEGKPKSPFRTWIARLPEDAAVARPICPIDNVPCDVVAHLNFTHHDLPFQLPGQSMLLFTNSVESLDAEAWHWTWLNRGDRARLESILLETDRCLSGPAVRVTEYDSDAVDKQLLDLSAPSAERYQSSSECKYFMFASVATKVGGGVFYIQGDPGVYDSEGNRMVFIGQVASTEFCEIGDSGIAYIHYSPVTQEVQILVSYF